MTSSRFIRRTTNNYLRTSLRESSNLWVRLNCPSNKETSRQNRRVRELHVDYGPSPRPAQDPVGEGSGFSSEKRKHLGTRKSAGLDH